MNIPKQVIFMIETLNKKGYKAYIVGGCVRDRIMNKLPNDWDIATSAHPNEVKSLFQKTYDTGIKHGTITVVIDNVKMEVTTFRIEDSYKDYRRPSHVTFTEDIVTDLGRRDFTINAMAYDILDERYIDPYNGYNDINNKRIKCVGIPKERFTEDPLRMLRAIRFSCQLGFDIEKRTYLAITESSYLINNISSERIKIEMDKILMSQYPQRILIAVKTGLLKHIIPEFESTIYYKQGNPYHIYTVGVHSLVAVKNLEEDIILRWTMLLHDIGKPFCRSIDEKGITHFYKHSIESVSLAKDILKRLKFDKKSAEKIIRLIKWHDRPLIAERIAVIKAMRSIGVDIFNDILKIRKADIVAQNPLHTDERLKKLDKVKCIYDKIIMEKQCITIKDLDITGRDLIELGFKEGKDIGIILNKLLDKVIEHPGTNKKQELLDIARKTLWSEVLVERMNYMQRLDNRSYDNIRKVKITNNFTKYAEGSVLIEMGDTKVICNATVEDKVPIFKKGSGEGWITAEYSMLPRATQERNMRSINRLKLDGRTMEIQRLIGRALRSVVDLSALGEITITIDCDVIQADGGTRTAAITGGFVAMMKAFQKLVSDAKLSKIPVSSFISAVSVGIVDGEALLDLCYQEDSQAQVDMNVIMNEKGHFVEIQGTGEQFPFSRQELDKLLSLAEIGTRELIIIQKQALKWSEKNENSCGNPE